MLFRSEGDLLVESYDHHFYIKRLKKIKRFGFSLDKILIVDDTPHKSSENYGNAIYPNEFTGNGQDNELSLLIDYLKTLKYVDNVRRIEKRNWREELKS